MRSVWKGAVAFGLVNVPVRLYSATTDHDIRFHQVHRGDGGRIRYKRTCDVCGEEVPYAEIDKGSESDDGRVVVLTKDDFDSLPVVTGREIDVVEFVPADEVDPLLLDKSYYLEPDEKALKPYALLREALAETDRMALVKIALRQRESLAVLRVRDNVIVLQTMLWPDELRRPEFPLLDREVTVRRQEVTMASSLVESLAAPFEPARFEDEYKAALEALIEAKLSGGEVRAVETASERDAGGDVDDLVSALRRSVDAAKARSGAAAEKPAAGGGGGSKASGAAATGKTAAATRKTAAKKASGTKAASATAKKAPAKKSTTAKATDKATAEKINSAAKKAADKKTTAAKKAPAAKTTATKKATASTRKSA